MMELDARTMSGSRRTFADMTSRRIAAAAVLAATLALSAPARAGGPPYPPYPPPPSYPPPPARTLESDELAALYDRSVALVEQGDIASARLMLTRAAEAGDARSALALGATYDPDGLKKLGVIGIAADPTQARSWYAKAVELGSAEAITRLERLAQATR